jgi:predicted nucleic acid-binding protein
MHRAARASTPVTADAVVAAARTLGCDVPYSEDMGHGQTIAGVTITNPFR